MTGAPQPDREPEYIVTEMQLKRQRVEFFSMTGRKKFEKELRSRPYKPTTTSAEMVLGGAKRALQDSVQCLREMHDWVQCGKCPFRVKKKDGYYNCRLDVLDKLRQQQGER